jgi:toxin YoeB
VTTRGGTERTNWHLEFHRRAQRDAKLVQRSGLKGTVEELLALLERDPFESPPPFEKLTGNMSGAFSRRLNIQHRLVYEVLPDERIVRILRMWSHYD